MNDPIRWEPSLVKKFSSSNHLKLLNQLRNEVKKYPLNNKKNSIEIHNKNINQVIKNKSNEEYSQKEPYSKDSNTDSDINTYKSNVSFNNSKNFSIYKQTTNNNISRQNESLIPNQSQSSQETSSQSFKERLNKIDMK